MLDLGIDSALARERVDRDEWRSTPGPMNLLRTQKAAQPNISSQSVRYLNELRALDVLFREGGMSRADLARALGVNRSTTSSIITNLIADSLVVEQSNMKRIQPANRTGRPGIEIELNPTGAHFIGGAIEADRLTALMIDLSGRVVRKKTAPFHASRYGPDKAALAVAKLINALVTAEPGRTRILGACVAVPAMFQDGVLLQARLLGWRNVDIRAMIAANLSADWPVAVENDANAFAIAETYCGSTPPATTVACLLIDSGAGGGIVNGGRLLRGGFGLAGEFGHIRVGRRGYAQDRGEPGELESFVGKEAVLARYAFRGGDPGSKLPGFLRALEGGEPAAVMTARNWGLRLARGIVPIVNVINPSLVIVGGPMAPILHLIGDRVAARVRAELPRGFPQPRIEVSRLGPEGPAFGAALLLHQRAFSVDERTLYPDGGARNLFGI